MRGCAADGDLMGGPERGPLASPAVTYMTEDLSARQPRPSACLWWPGRVIFQGG